MPSHAARRLMVAVTMLVNVPVQTLWISYSPITPHAARYYGVDDFGVVALSMVFMAVYVLVSVPASWLIDTRGVRTAVGLGAVLIGVGGLARGLAGPSYPLALAASVLVAIGQPFVLNAWTAMPGQWFEENQRAGIVGLTTVASLVGTALGFVLPPLLVDSVAVGTMQTWFGLAALVAAAAYLAVYRDGPAFDDVPRSLVTDGLRHAVAVPAFRTWLGCAFVGMGVFNAISSLTAEIVAPRGLGAIEAGNVGAALLGGGLLGAAVLPHLSDTRGRRVPFLVAGLGAGAVPVALLGVVGNAAVLYVVAALAGAAMVPLLPIGMEYAAELVHPTPDGTSSGIVQIAGQASVAWIGLLWLVRNATGSFTPGLVVSGALLAVLAVVTSRLPEGHRERGTGPDTPVAGHDTVTDTATAPAAVPEATTGH